MKTLVRCSCTVHSNTGAPRSTLHVTAFELSTPEKMQNTGNTYEWRLHLCMAVLSTPSTSGWHIQHVQVTRFPSCHCARLHTSSLFRSEKANRNKIRLQLKKSNVILFTSSLPTQCREAWPTTTTWSSKALAFAIATGVERTKRGSWEYLRWNHFSERIQDMQI